MICSAGQFVDATDCVFNGTDIEDGVAIDSAVVKNPDAVPWMSISTVLTIIQ